MTRERARGGGGEKRPRETPTGGGGGGGPLNFFSPVSASVPQEKSIRKFSSQGKLMVTRRPTVYLLPEAELARGLNVGLETHSRWSLLREF
jgi:hypothetical protein